MSCCSKKACAITSLVIGAIVLVLGGVVMFVYDILFEKILTQEMQISQGTFFYEDLWKEVVTPTYLDYYFFNVTNKEEFLKQSPPGSVKLRVEEVGPYRYREYLKKDHKKVLIEQWPEEIEFRQVSEIFFVPEMSVGPDTDLITTVDVVAASLVPILEFNNNHSALDTATYAAINRALNSAGANLLTERSVRGLLYGSQEPVAKEILDLVARVQPEARILDNFGLVMNTNNSNGWFDYQVYTGRDYNIGQLNIITKFKGESKLSYWNTEYCNMINGTDGTSTPPFMKKEDPVYFFVDDVCRSLYGIYEKEVVLRGVTGWLITTPAEIFQSPLLNDDNKCFCHDFDNVLCQHDGAIGIEYCQLGAPVAISAPHFLFGEDGYFFSQTEGWSPPEKDLHVSELVYEPNTGVVIKADKRLQINILLNPNKLIDLYQPISEPYLMPVFWANENAELSDEDADLLISLLYNIEDAMRIIQIVACIVGGVLFASSVFYLSYSAFSDKDDQNSLKGKHNRSYSSESSSEVYESSAKKRNKTTKI